MVNAASVKFARLLFTALVAVALFSLVARGDSIDWAIGNGDVVRLKEALERGEDPNQRPPWGELPLIRAVGTGSVEMVRVLLDSGADPNLRDDRGAPLEAAVCKPEIMQLLISHGARVQEPGKYYGPPLTQAAMMGCEENVRILLAAGANITYDYHNPLIVALTGRHAGIARILIESGADPNRDLPHTSGSDNSPLLRAIGEGLEETALLLVERGANLRPKSKDWWAPLQLAEWKRLDRLVGVMLARRADKRGWQTARLMRGCETASPSLVRDAIAAGAKIDARLPMQTESALAVAARSGCLECVDVLLRQRAEVNSTDRASRTPLMEAAKAGHAGVVARLLDAGSGIDAQDYLGCTPLILAADNRRADVVTVLLSQGADPNLVSRDGGLSDVIEIGLGTALNAAVRNDDGRMVRELVAAGAVVSGYAGVEDFGRPSDLSLAVRHGNVGIVRMLLDARPELASQAGRVLAQAEEDGQVEIAAELRKRGAPAARSIALRWQRVADAMTCGAGDGDVDAVIEASRADPTLLDERDSKGLTPLAAAIKNHQMLMVMTLVDAGADVNLRGGLGSASLTPLEWALLGEEGWIEWRGGRPPYSRRENLDMIRFLVDAGAKVTVTDSRTQPVEFARTPEAIEYLVANGASLGDGIGGRMLLIWAPSSGAERMMAAIASRLEKRSPDVTKALCGASPGSRDLLLAAGASTSGAEECLVCGAIKLHGAAAQLRRFRQLGIGFPSTCVHRPIVLYTVEEADPDALVALHEAGVELDEGRDFYGDTALHFVAKRGMPDHLRTLTTLVSQLNPRNGKGETPLIVAAAAGRLDAVRILVEAGADPRVRDQVRKSALDWATEYGFKDVIAELSRAK